MRTARILLAAVSSIVLLAGLTGSASASTDVLHHEMKAKAAKPGRAGTSNLTYHGGNVEPNPVVYVVYWGWGGNDPSGERAYYENFLNGVGGSSWLNSVTQYCQGVASGTVFCGASGTPAGNPTTLFSSLNTWADDVDPIPSPPTQGDLANEAIRAAAHFGNTTSASNLSRQYVIATPHGNSTTGFGTQFCAWHSSTSSVYGGIAYTNLPYITDAGASCGQSFVNAGAAGALDGVSIVGGHELAETITDQFPNGGWLDRNGAENGDKCAWISAGQGAAADVALTTGSFAVQSLWSNAFNAGAGGCVISYP